MIWVRLIGGIANNQVVKVDPDQQEHMRQTSVPLARRGITIGSMSAEVKQTLYTRREVATERGPIVFFADKAMSDHEALYSVLGP